MQSPPELDMCKPDLHYLPNKRNKEIDVAKSWHSLPRAIYESVLPDLTILFAILLLGITWSSSLEEEVGIGW